MKREWTFKSKLLCYLDGYLPPADCAFLIGELNQGAWRRSRVTRYTKRKTARS